MSHLLDESAISHALNGGYWRVSVVEETPSTQSMLRESKPKHGDVIVAEYQSAGRGRLDRTFEADSHTALLFSFYIKPQCSTERFTFIPLLAGLVVAETLNTYVCSGFTTKWPNDILHGDKKVAGLLVERCGDGLIVGIGINTSMTQAQLPVPTATSLLLIHGAAPDRNQLLAEILKAFATALADWSTGHDFVARYAALSSTLGCDIEITLPNKSVTRGRASSVDASGALVLATGESITVGDVVHVRVATD
jgi:BirA family biotin operon repressor/biotin-[acetyl-CoA-carboxylase] ligase